MRMKLLCLVFAFATAVQAASIDSGRLAKAMPLDVAMSEKIFDHYLKALDSEKLLFIQGDIDRLAGIRTKLGNAIIEEDLTVPFAIFNL